MSYPMTYSPAEIRSTMVPVLVLSFTPTEPSAVARSQNAGS